MTTAANTRRATASQAGPAALVPEAASNKLRGTVTSLAQTSADAHRHARQGGGKQTNACRTKHYRHGEKHNAAPLCLARASCWFEGAGPGGRTARAVALHGCVSGEVRFQVPVGDRLAGQIVTCCGCPAVHCPLSMQVIPRPPARLLVRLPNHMRPTILNACHLISTPPPCAVPQPRSQRPNIMSAVAQHVVHAVICVIIGAMLSFGQRHFCRRTVRRCCPRCPSTPSSAAPAPAPAFSFPLPQPARRWPVRPSRCRPCR